jgi:K+-sensing histidine kinase KdpD
MAFDDLWLRIQHNGKDISLNEQKNLFEPFNQEDSAKNEVDKVMHLSFCHFIITEQHQGQIAVTCNEDDGTIFHIQLPTK